MSTTGPQQMASANYQPEIQIVVAGLPRTGKSTGLNNIFDLKLPAGLSATPITNAVTIIKITKNGVPVTVIDTPGLRSANANSDKTVLREMAELKGKPILLVLTLSVSFSSCITEDYCHIIANITSIFGRGVWEWSLILLTFSDEASSLSESCQKYVDFLKSHCMELQKVLAMNNVKKPVKLFFEYTSHDQFQHDSLDGIVAIPVGRVSAIPTRNLFPMQPWTHNSTWNLLAFEEILKLDKQILTMERLKRDRKMEEANQLRSILLQLRFGPDSVSDAVQKILTAAAKGAACIAPLGSTIGTLFSPAGTAIGGAVGAVAGALGVGGVVAMGEIIDCIILQRKIEHIERRLKELDCN